MRILQENHIFQLECDKEQNTLGWNGAGVEHEGGAENGGREANTSAAVICNKGSFLVKSGFFL